ncbi:T-cell surface glycoprotein CD4-like [Lacerta agilis]|uniref:T-cell surface glycoprotein CD4-like n=1 Tax=Lacerta agilis TaxID=80427 RepID=UPI001419DCC6|nr:T-cell surface glycoprotein CD4-like [Lacerta agilis]
MRNGKEGQYTCEAHGKIKTTNLNLWSVKGPSDEYLLEGDITQLELSSLDMSTPVEWFGPNKSKITDKKARWTLQNKDRRLQIKDLNAQEDQGTWECIISRSGLRITHDVKVIGFVNSLDVDTRYAAVNSTVVLSCELNINFQEIPKNILRSPVLRWMNDNKTIMEVDLNNFNSSLLQQKIDKVQFEHAGEHKCSIEFTWRNLSKTIHLVVMKVSADRPRLDSKENVTLCCHVSAPDLSKSQLCWNNKHGSPKCETHLPEGKFCYGTRSAGEWKCSLMVQDKEKLSMIYFVDDGSAAMLNSFPLTYIAIGAGVMLLLLIIIGVCVFSSKTVKQKRQRARRMAQARQHLLEKKTCQCHKELTNDYYHA